MEPTEEIIAPEDLQWAREQAAARNTSVAAVLSETIRVRRQHEAIQELLDEVDPPITQAEMDAVRAEWTR